PPSGVSIPNHAAVLHELLRLWTVHAPFPNGWLRTRLLEAAHVNRFLVRAPYRIEGRTSHRGELTKAVAIGPNDVGFGPCAGSNLKKRQVKIVRRPASCTQYFSGGEFYLVAAVDIRHPEFGPLAFGECDVHHALSIRRDPGLGCVLRCDVR